MRAPARVRWSSTRNTRPFRSQSGETSPNEHAIVGDRRDRFDCVLELVPGSEEFADEVGDVLEPTAGSRLGELLNGVVVALGIAEPRNQARDVARVGVVLAEPYPHSRRGRE